MIDLSGIRYRLVACDLFYLLGGLAILSASKFWQPTMLNKKYLSSGIFCTAVAVFCIIFHLVALLNPALVSCTGTLLESRRTSRSAPPWPVTWQYVFVSDDGKVVLELDAFSAKKILPQNGLTENSTYQIVYEDKTNVIVLIEETDQSPIIQIE